MFAVQSGLTFSYPIRRAWLAGQLVTPPRSAGDTQRDDTRPGPGNRAVSARPEPR